MKLLKRIAWLEYVLLRLLIRFFFLGKTRRDRFAKRRVVDIDSFMHKHFLDKSLGFVIPLNEEEAYIEFCKLHAIVPFDCARVPDEVKRLYLRPKSKDVVIDAGAHYGFYTLFASRLVGDEGTVLSFEPHPHNYKRLVTNLNLNRINNVKTFNMALGEKNGQAKLHIGEQSGTHSIKPELSSHTFRHGFTQVEVVTIDTIMAREVGIGKIHLIKIDAEGLELSILKGASGTIQKSKPKLTIASYHFPTEITEIKEWLKTNYPFYNIKIIDNRFLHAYVK